MGEDRRRILIRERADAEAVFANVSRSAQHTANFLRANSDQPLEFLRKIRFHEVGLCPITSESRPLNIVEQLNQTFTVLVSLRATEKLFDMHPDADGFELALGTCPGFDIQSVKPGLVVAEVFSATKHTSNSKLTRDINRLKETDNFSHKYVFFAAPGYAVGRHTNLEKNSGVKVYVIDI